MEYPNGLTEEDCGNCGQDRSNYEAEGIAIYLALYKVAKWMEDFSVGGEEERPKQVVVFLDAKSVVHRFRNWPAAGNDPILGEVVRVVDTLSAE